jgi:prophage regulatory protein
MTLNFKEFHVLRGGAPLLEAADDRLRVIPIIQVFQGVANMTRRILRRPAVKTKTGLPNSTLYQLIAEGKFPKQFRIGIRAVGWLEDDVDAWIDSKVAPTAIANSTELGNVVVRTPPRPAGVKGLGDTDRLSR